MIGVVGWLVRMHGGRGSARKLCRDGDPQYDIVVRLVLLNSAELCGSRTVSMGQNILDIGRGF